MKQQLQNVLTRLLAAVLLSAVFLPLLLEAQPRRIDPFDPNIGLYTRLGEIRVAGTTDAWSIGDCNRDGLGDWILQREIPDTLFKNLAWQARGKELFLFKGIRDSLTSDSSGVRIGPTERNIDIRLIASGDWDNDSHQDLAVSWRLFDDSLYSTRGTTQYEVAIFWGNSLGEYSINDTSRLYCRGDAWIGNACSGLGKDIDGDGIDDLMIAPCGTPGGSVGTARLIGGESIPAPVVAIFLGQNLGRWGQDEFSRHPNWEWWDTPAFNRTSARTIDQNCDDAPDIVLYHDNRGPDGGHVSILYGSPDGGLPDTNNLVTIALKDPFPGESSQLMDITGDAVLDLIVLDDLATAYLTTDSQHFRIYVGEPGENIADLFGDGLDPWARVPTPMVLHDGWGGYLKRIYDLGDHNDDGYRDLFFSHYPFIVSYTTGWVLDSLIDGVARFDGNYFRDFVNVGDIMGRGRDAIMVVHHNGLDFIEGGKHINRAGAGRKLPHVTATRRCFSSVSVPTPLQDDGVLKVSPNPATSTVDIRWTITDSWDTGRLEIVDVAGRIVYRSALPDRTGSLLWDSAQVPPGTYIVHLSYGDSTRSESIIVR